MTIMRRHFLAVGLLGLLASPAAAAESLTVFAAASLTDAIKDVSTAWEKAGHPPLRLSFGASSTLARQIEQGAPPTCLHRLTSAGWTTWPSST